MINKNNRQTYTAEEGQVANAVFLDKETVNEKRLLERGAEMLKIRGIYV